MNEELILKKLQELEKQVNTLVRSPKVADHYHNGFDSSRVQWSDTDDKRVYLSHTIIGADAATAANYTVFFINQIGACYISRIYEVHQTAGSSADAALNIEKLTGTQALDAGVATLKTAFELDATANVVRTGTLTETLANRNLAVGDRLALDDAGTLTAVANVTIFVELTLV